MGRGLFFIFLLLLPVGLRASARQEDRDSLVRLLSADRARLVEYQGRQVRRVDGNVCFLHNDTYLQCDSAWWDVEGEFIDAVGRVKIIQDKTTLTGESLRYKIDLDLARFTGSLVELKDKSGNTLRTVVLDYNTKDSVARFFDGASMRDSSGNVIESERGRYDSRTALFTFIKNVQMFSDSMFFISDTLKYDSDRNVAYFTGRTNGWYDLNHLRSDRGRYDRNSEKFDFEGDVHILTEEYEVWCKKLFYDRKAEFSHLNGSVQLLDTVDNGIVLGEDLRYWNNPRRVEIYEKPVVLMVREDEFGIDTLFLASDSLLLYQQRMFEVDSAVAAAAVERVRLSRIDPLESIVNKAASQGTEPAGPGRTSGEKDASLLAGVSAAKDTSRTGMADSLSGMQQIAPRDSVRSGAEAPDTVAAVQPDTTTVSFLQAFPNVRMFRPDIQMVCDSLLFCSIDSMARLFKDPVLWQDIRTQVTSDSMQFVIRNRELDKGFMLSDAFVISEEEPEKYYHQVKSPEMIAHFSGSDLIRFDAVGGAGAILYIAEDSVFTTINQKESRIISATLKDGELQKVRSYVGAKSDALPLYNLPMEKQRLKDFKWFGDRRPVDRFAITDRKIRPSERRALTPSDLFPDFKNTREYYPDYMERIFLEIDDRKPLIWLKK